MSAYWLLMEGSGEATCPQARVLSPPVSVSLSVEGKVGSTEQCWAWNLQVNVCVTTTAPPPASRWDSVGQSSATDPLRKGACDVAGHHNSVWVAWEVFGACVLLRSAASCEWRRPNDDIIRSELKRF